MNKLILFLMLLNGSAESMILILSNKKTNYIKDFSNYQKRAFEEVRKFTNLPPELSVVIISNFPSSKQATQSLNNALTDETLLLEKRLSEVKEAIFHGADVGLCYDLFVFLHIIRYPEIFKLLLDHDVDPSKGKDGKEFNALIRGYPESKKNL